MGRCLWLAAATAQQTAPGGLSRRSVGAPGKGSLPWLAAAMLGQAAPAQWGCRCRGCSGCCLLSLLPGKAPYLLPDHSLA